MKKQKQNPNPRNPHIEGKIQKRLVYFIQIDQHDDNQFRILVTSKNPSLEVESDILYQKEEK